MEGLAHNTVKSYETKISFVEKYLKPLLLKDFTPLLRSWFRLLSLTESMITLKYYDKDIWERTLKNYAAKIKTRVNIYKIVKLYNQLKEIHQKGVLHRDITPELEVFKQKILSRADYKWVYNLEQNRYHTF